MRNLYVLSGASGVGKGTRVVQFMMFLEDYLGLRPKLLIMNRDKKSETIGRHYPDLNFTVIGRFMNNRANGKISWSGWDCVCHNNSGYEMLNVLGTEINVLSADLVRHLIKTWGSHWVVEGYPELAPTSASMWDYFDNLYEQFYIYKNLEQDLVQRCRERTGNMESSFSAALSRQSSVISLTTQVDRLNWALNGSLDISKYHKYLLNHDSSLAEFGLLVLDSLGMSELKPMYEQFCIDTPYLRQYNLDNMPGFVTKYNQQSELEKIHVDYSDLITDGLLFRTRKDKTEKSTWREVKDGKLEFRDLDRFSFPSGLIPTKTQYEKALKEKGEG
ncbi:hypothetical protein [Campylobacter jejuni]|uniref:Uncharacterized protein n=1 Tax=Campylobacter jejuni TaxID=197 RepID=A0A431EB39_CAMJU|nr:hypothetical protein [Campylobacter jejuni]RTJ78341.1 hypothetical protein C3H57_08525 [Campylobacter jejuni]